MDRDCGFNSDFSHQQLLKWTSVSNLRLLQMIFNLLQNNVCSQKLLGCFLVAHSEPLTIFYVNHISSN